MKNHHSGAKKSKEEKLPPEIEDPAFWAGVVNDIHELVHILRGAEFDEKCAASNHEMKLCTVCVPDINDFLKRMKTYKGPLTFLGRPSSH